MTVDGGVHGRGAPSISPWGSDEKDPLACPRREEFVHIFPLPLRPFVTRAAGPGRRAGQKEAGRRRRANDFNGVVKALNWMAGVGDAVRPLSSNSEQAAVHALIEDRMFRLWAFDEATPSPKAAFMALLKGRSVYDADVGRANLTSFSKVALVSLPESLDGAPFVDEAVPAEALHFLEEGYERMLRPVEEAAAEDAALGEIRPYWDPVLQRNRRKFLTLVRHLLRLGLVVALPAGSAREHAALFFVKKPGKSKCSVIVDARRANRVFAKPPGVSMAIAETFARLELIAGEAPAPSVSLGLCDIRDAFHRFRFRPELAAFFCIGVASAAELKMVGQRVGGKTLVASDAVELAWGSLPMGFSWSLYFCQISAERVVGDVPGLAGASCLRDRGATGVLDLRDTADPEKAAAFYVYVDNVGVFTGSAVFTTSALHACAAALTAAGLPTHEEEVSTQSAKALGIHLDLEKFEAAVATPRLWRVKMAVRYALGCHALPGRVWDIIVGHLTFCALLDRSALPCLGCIYAFIRKHYHSWAPLWTSAAAEVRHLTALLPFLAAGWPRPWVR